MSSIRMPLFLTSLLALMPLLSACHDDVIPEAPPATTPGPAPMASFTPDPVGTEPGVRIKLVEVKGRNALGFALETTWPMDRLHGASLLLRIDPGAQAQIGLVPGGLAPGAAHCGTSSAAYDDTGFPGQWVLWVPAMEGDCPCPLPEGFEPGPLTLALLNVSQLEPGDWRIDLGAAAIFPVCGCEDCASSSMPFYGGTIHVAPPS